MTMKHRYTVSAEDAFEGTLGICLACGAINDGVEPDASDYECEHCHANEVMGIEDALIMGYVDLDEDEE